MSRKTIEVRKVIDLINTQLERPLDEVGTETKAALCHIVEDMLFAIDSYRGFQHVNMDLETRQSINPDDPRYFNRCYYTR